MITVSTLTRPNVAPRVSAGHVLVASVDVEWTKNYKIPGGNRPFCVSVVYLDLPRHGTVDLAHAEFEYTSVYLEPDEPTSDLVASADTLLGALLDKADIITGHQLSSDLAVLTACAARPVKAVAAARAAWHARRSERPRRVIDTRYDTNHLLANRSRRLVDIATELSLDVTQPELHGTSMTALHRTWLETGDHTARERISVLNLRHSVSTALIALRAAGRGAWNGPVNVNRLLADGATGAWRWLDSATFRALLKEPHADT